MGQSSRVIRCSLNVTFHYPGRPLSDALDGARAAGFRTIELLDPYAQDLDDLERALERRGLRVDVFNLPMGDFAGGERGFAGDPGRRAEFQAGVKSAIRIAERLGVTKLNALAGSRVDGETAASQHDCLVEQLAWAAERSSEHGVRLMTELLNPSDTPGFLLPSLDTVRLVLDELDGQVAFQLDLFHLARAGYDLVSSIEAMATSTGHYQVADAPGRTEPGSGTSDIAAALGAIAATGYDGLVGCEYRPSAADVDAFAWMAQLGVAPG